MRDVIPWRLVSLLVALTVPLALAAYAERDQTTAARPDPAYRALHQSYRRQSAQIGPASVVFLGDSHILGLAVGNVAPHSLNFGIGGDTTAGVLARLPDYPGLRRVRLVVVAVGINDLRQCLDSEIIRNLGAILDALPCPVLLSAILPVDEARQPDKRGYNARIRTINARLADLAHEHGARFVDAGPGLVDHTGNLRADYSEDGQHLNAAGYAIWTAALREAIP